MVISPIFAFITALSAPPRFAQMACKDFGLDPLSASMLLTHKRAIVDLSQPFRFTGIPQNATLELTVSGYGRSFFGNAAVDARSVCTGNE